MASEIKVDTIVNAGGDNDSGIDLGTNDEVKIKTANTNHVVIDSAGNMGLGTTSVSNIGAANRVLEINGAGLSPWIHFTNNTSGTGANDGTLIGTEGADTFILNRESGTTRFHTDNTERMRISSSGNVSIGTTTTNNARLDVRTSSGSESACKFTADSTANVAAVIIKHDRVDGSDTGTIMNFQKQNGASGGSITMTTSATTYVTSSDYRLKENVVTDWDATTRLKQLKPSRFNFIEAKDKTMDGFLAHEVSSIVPTAIVGEKDAVEKDGSIKPQGIDLSQLVPLLTKSLQEALARIDTLEAKVKELESK